MADYIVIEKAVRDPLLHSLVSLLLYCQTKRGILVSFLQQDKTSSRIYIPCGTES